MAGFFLRGLFLRALCPPDAGYGSRDRGNRSLYLPAPGSHGRIAAHSAKLRSYICTIGKEGKIMRKLLSGVLILLLAAGPLVAQTNEWKRYKNTDGNFSVLFPGQPEDTVNKTEEGVQSHTLLAKED